MELKQLKFTKLVACKLHLAVLRDSVNISSSGLPNTNRVQSCRRGLSNNNKYYYCSNGKQALPIEYHTVYSKFLLSNPDKPISSVLQSRNHE